MSDPAHTDPLNGAETPDDYVCVACMTKHTGDRIDIHGHPMCKDCFMNGIVPQFHAALKDETQYPVTFGGREIKIDNISDFFSEQFLAEWAEKQKEIWTPTADRLYCANPACSVFLGVKSQHQSNEKCPSCETQTCANCNSAIVNGKHECKQVEQADPFEGLQRGKEYQKCPGCDTPVQLKAACNHMTCEFAACKTHFCYICGERAIRNSGHWDYGGCPLYNDPEAENAMFANENVMFADPPLPEGVDAAVMELVNRGIRAARHQGEVPADAAPEVRQRHVHRQQLMEIATDATRQVVPALMGRLADALDDQNDLFFRLLGVMTLASTLMGSIDVYAIHLEPDVNTRAAMLNDVELVHEYLQRQAGGAGDEGLQLYPQLAEIYQSYLRAREALLQEQGP